MFDCRQGVFLLEGFILSTPDVSLIHVAKQFQFGFVCPQDGVPELLWLCDVVFHIFQATLLVLVLQKGGSSGLPGIKAFSPKSATHAPPRRMINPALAASRLIASEGQSSRQSFQNRDFYLR